MYPSSADSVGIGDKNSTTEMPDNYSEEKPVLSFSVSKGLLGCGGEGKSPLRNFSLPNLDVD